MHRRDMLQGALGLAAGATLGRPALAAPLGRLAFAVYRDESEIGQHTLDFALEGERLTVDIDIELEVKIAFITAYRYSHQNRVTWSGGRLEGFASRTDDNGTAYRVEAAQKGDHLVIDGEKGQITAPADTLPATYWPAGFVTRKRWINTQTGALIHSTVTSLGRETVEAEGEATTAERFGLRGDVDLDLWYAEGRWVKLAFTGPKGSRIDYRQTDGSAYRSPALRRNEPGRS